MARTPTGTAGRYLDVLRTLGVPDSAIRRRHDVAVDAPLRATLAGELSEPSGRLLDLLAGTGVVLDLEAAAERDGTPLPTALGRFGFDVECTALGDELEVVATDRLGDFVTHLRAGPGDEFRSALADRLLEEAGLVAVPIIDGRTLLTERRALAALQARYGRRLEPFATPLLGVDVPEFEAPGSEVGAVTPGRADRPAESAPSASEQPAPGPTPVPSEDATAAEDESTAREASVDEVLASADEDAVAALKDDLEEGGPAVHTVDEPVDDVDEAAASLGGGPRRTVSSSGIDDVFDEIESAAERTEAACQSTADDPFTQPAGDAARSSEGGLAGGGPDRTVSDTSADDILAEARGDADFESIAAEQGADPDAVLDDADDLPDAAPDDAGTGSASGSDGAAAERASTDRAEGSGDSPRDGASSAGDGRPASDGGIVRRVALSEAKRRSSLDEADDEITLERGRSSTDGPFAERDDLWTDDGDEPSDDDGGPNLAERVRSVLRD